MRIDWVKEWEDEDARPCTNCKYYWRNGDGCDMLDCINRPDQQVDHFEEREEKEPKDGLGFEIHFKVGKDKYHIKSEGKNEFEDTIDEIGIVQEQARQNSEEKQMQKRVLGDEEDG